LQLREIQQRLFNDLISPKISPRDFVFVARKWCILEDRKRIMKMIPKPKGINVSAIALARRLRRCQAQFAPLVEAPWLVECQRLCHRPDRAARRFRRF
jgi:hypothetical protein